MHAYLGITPDGTYQLCVSLTALNPCGIRLERGPQKRLPESVTRQAENPADGPAALAGLKSLQRFLEGKERGPGPLEFGVDTLPQVRKKKE